MRARVLVALLLAAAAPARAAFEDLGVGARAPGMGNAFVPVADDVYSIYYNPAGLGLLERPELGSSYSVLFQGLQDGSSLGTSFIGYAQPLAEGKNGTLATAWNSLTLSSLYREDTLYLSYGRRALELQAGELYAGGSLKYLHSGFGSFPEATNAVPTGGVVGAGQTDPVLNGARSQTTIDSDFGLLYTLGQNYSAGLDVMHANSPNVAFAGGAADRLPAAVKLGLDYRSLISNVVVEYDTQQSPNGGPDQTFTAAAERWIPKLFLGDFGVRGSISVGTREYKEFSAGVSYRTRRMTVDYAMTFPVGGIAAPISSQRVALTFRFGRATDKEESLEMALEAMKQVKAGQSQSLPGGDDADRATRLVLTEYLAQERLLESHAQYKDALDKFTLALSVAPADKAFAERYGRLSFVAQQIHALPEYRSDPVQASLHLGVVRYVAGDYPAAVQKVSEALALAPTRKDIDGFLTQLEVATGLKRALFAGGKTPDRQIALRLTQADAALEDGRYDEAVTLSLEALRLDPSNAAIWENLGTAYFALKDYPSSIKSWNKAYEYEKSPAIRTAIRGYIRSISRARDSGAARPPAPARTPAPAPSAAPPLPERPSMTPREEADLFNQAVDFYTRQDFVHARALFEKIVASDPGNVEAQAALRRIKEEQQ